MKPRTLVAIDPGAKHNGVVLLQCPEPDAACERNPVRILLAETMTFAELMGYLRLWHSGTTCVYEWVASYGMPVGADVFETCYVCGRIDGQLQRPGERILRRTIKLALCASATASDANVRQSLIDRFEPSGGGRVPQIGIKSKPGPLHRVKKHAWSALAAGVAYLQLRSEVATNAVS